MSRKGGEISLFSSLTEGLGLTQIPGPEAVTSPMLSSFLTRIFLQTKREDPLGCLRRKSFWFEIFTNFLLPQEREIFTEVHFPVVKSCP